MADLSQASVIWSMVRDESIKHITNNDIKGLFNSEIINHCVMESARLGAHIFPIGRKPIQKNAIGSYYLDIDNIDNIALCLP